MVTDRFKLILVTVLATVVLFTTAEEEEDKPCAARQIFNRSVICVCDPTYCDTITRTVPEVGEFVTYVSTESGERFNKTKSSLQAYEESEQCSLTLELYPTTLYQTIQGFGGAVTDSTAIVWDSLGDEVLKQHLIDSYASDSGIQYNMLRVPIGGCDCSTRLYALNELPVNDTLLSNFTLAPEDYNYKIPMIQALMNASSTDIDILANVWSPPRWMKDNNEYYGVSHLKEEFYQTYADYHLKFIKEYKSFGIPIWGVTTGNEPLTSVTSLGNINSLGWTLTAMGTWILNYMAPTLKGYDSNLKLIGVDDQRYAILIWFNNIANKMPEVANVLDGVGVHFYVDDLVHPALLTKPLEKYPHLFVISTEASAGIRSEIDVDLGSWTRAELYANDILEDLNYNVTGWLDWNMCLNEQGGPSWISSFLDSPIIVPSNETAFYKQPMFYAMGHFSKFMPKGSQRIRTVGSSTSLNHVAVMTPDNTIVVVFLNREKNNVEVTIKLGGKQAHVVLKSASITTIEFGYDSEDEEALHVEYDRTCGCN